MYQISLSILSIFCVPPMEIMKDVNLPILVPFKGMYFTGDGAKEG